MKMKLLFVISLIPLLFFSANADQTSACTLLTAKEVNGWLGAGLKAQARVGKAPMTKPGSNQVTSTVPSSNCDYASANTGLSLEVVPFTSAQIAQEQAKARQAVMKLSMPNLKITGLNSPSAGAFFLDVTMRFPTTILGFTKKNIFVTITVFQKNKNSLEVAKSAAKLIFSRLP